MEQLSFPGIDPDEQALAAERVRDCIAAGLPTTVAEVITTLCENTKRGTPTKRHEAMNPSRYTHSMDLLRAGVAPHLVTGAISRINASGWLKKPALDVTEDDLVTAMGLAEKAGVEP